MEVFITGTPEINNDEIGRVVDFLNCQKGPINFIDLEVLSKESLERIIEDYNPDYGFQVESLNKISKSYRFKNDLHFSQYLVVLTSYKLDFEYYNTEKKWFSYFRDKDFFIRTNDWETFSRNLPHIAIAHQTVECLFQSLQGYPLGHFDNYHLKPIGCINDFCSNENDISIKFNSGRICDQCVELASQNASIDVLIQIKEIIDLVRNELSDFKSILLSRQIPSLRVTENLEIFIGDTLIPFDPKRKMFYLYMLLHKDEYISIESLRSNLDGLKTLFNLLKRGTSLKPIFTLLNLITEDDGRHFTKGDKSKAVKNVKDLRNEISNILRENVNAEIARLYSIDSIVLKGPVDNYCSIFHSKEGVVIDLPGQLLNYI
jgi:hypothetical protein